MRKFALAAAAVAVLAGTSVQARDADSGTVSPGEASLARLLEGRVAEAPVNCINNRIITETQIINNTAIVFGRGDVIYVNRPRDPQGLRRNDILVTRQTGPELCDLDRAHMTDAGGMGMVSVLMLGKFVPYRKVAKN